MNGKSSIKPVTGREMAKHRVRVSFEFDVTCNDGPVRNESYDEGGTMDMALLTSFLTADKERLLVMLMDAIAMQLGLNGSESFTEAFLPDVDTDCHQLFKPAIDALSGDEQRYWREQIEDTDTRYGNWMSVCTEKIFECFKAEFVRSDYQIVEERQEP